MLSQVKAQIRLNTENSVSSSQRPANTIKLIAHPSN
ncbi:Uncharacterised protein [Vibrio cholerae]|nr:Uncharacterised protein [Vibrio cholerae]